jgi:hypothetical protein
MKNLVYVLLALFLITLVVNGCKKSEMTAVPKSKLALNSLLADSSRKLTASQLTTTKNRADTFTISGLSSTDTVHWSIAPPGYTNILQKSNSRYIVSFETEGTFKIKAIVNGTDTLSASIKVDSASTVPPYSSVSLAGDQILLIPALYKSVGGDTTYIALTAQTTKTYPCANSLIHCSYGTDTQNNFSVNFIDVQQPNSLLCMGGPGTLATNLNFYQKAQNPYMVNGTYPLSVTFNGSTYTGKIIISAKTIKFDWNYASGVVFSTKQISR